MVCAQSWHSRAFGLASAELEALKLMIGILEAQAERTRTQIQRFLQFSYPSKVWVHETAMVQSMVVEMHSWADHGQGRDNTMPWVGAWSDHDQPVVIPRAVLLPQLSDLHFEHPQKGQMCCTDTRPAASHSIAALMRVVAGGSKSTWDHRHQDNNVAEAPRPPVGIAVHEIGVPAIAGLGIDLVAKPAEGVGGAAPPMDCPVRWRSNRCAGTYTADTGRHTLVGALGEHGSLHAQRDLPSSLG
jgi:hypothetical protein